MNLGKVVGRHETGQGYNIVSELVLNKYITLQTKMTGLLHSVGTAMW